MDAATPLPDFDAMRRELEEARDAMRRAIEEVRAKPEIVQIFIRANQISVDATVRSRKKKNSTSHYAFRQIALRVDRLRGQWLKDLEKAGRRFMGRPGEGVKIGTPPPSDLIVLDDLDLGGNAGRRESQDLQLLADMSPEAFEALVADPTAPRPRSGPEKRVLLLSAIRVDERAQPRAALKDRVVDEYAEAMQRGAKFPAPVVFEDAAGVFWPGDGHRRYAAATKLKLKTIECEVRSGGLREAILYSCGANATHGLRRPNDDKHRAVTKLLKDDEWKDWTDNKIAKQCNVSNHLVAQLRKELESVTLNSPSEPRTYTTKHGNTATMRTGNIGRKPKPAANDAPDDVAQCDKPALVPEAAPEPVKEPAPADDDALAQELAPVPKPDDAPQTAPDQPASAPDAWARERAAVRDAIRGLLKLKDVDFGQAVATMPLDQLREAHTEVDEATNVAWEWVEALEQAIKSAAVGEEPAAWAPLSGERTQCVPTTSS
jgi:hypothetical protein